MNQLTKTIRIDLFFVLLTLIDYCVIARNIKFGFNPSLGIGSSSANLHRFILGQESTLERRVPADVEVHLSCRFTKPIWYRFDEELSHNRSLIIKNTSPKDSGRYACYTPVEFHGLKWSNLTLIVERNVGEADETTTTTISSKVMNDIADFKIVEDPSFKALMENEDDNVSDVSDVQEPAYQSSSETSSSPTTAFVQLPDTIHSAEKKAPSFWRSDKLQRLVQKTAGDILQLSCPGQGNPSPNITWFLNDVEVQNTLKQRVKLKKWSLSVEELQVSDAGLYKCMLCNLVACIEHTSKVNVLERVRSVPIIVPGTPHNLTVVANENAKFECRILSDLEPFIVWIRHRLQTQASVKELEQILPSITDFNTFSADYYRLPTDPDEPHVLHLQHVRPQQEGWYSCIAAHSLGRSMASAYLSVLDRVGTDQNGTGNAGQPKSQPFKQSPKLKFISRELTDEGQNLSVESDHNDIDYDAKDGDFDAKDTDVDIKDSDTNFSEESPPRFKKSDKLINFLHKPAGSSIQLICPAVGHPLPNITWTRNSTEITRHIGKVTYKKWSILMDDVITEDSGAYTCTLCNKLGCISHTTKLTIIDRLRSRPIHSDKFPQNQTVLTNGSAVFECKVVSDVAPHFMWIRYTRNNETIKELEKSVPALSRDIGSKYAKDFVKLDTDPDEPHVLRLANVTHADEGWYTCVAASNLGQSMASAYLKVVDKLPSREVQPLLRSHPIWITVVVIVVVLLFLMGAIFIIYVLRKLKHEKLLKHRIETVHQWTKKVIIYKPPSSQGSSCDLQMPVIKIEKQRTTFQTSSNSDPTQAFNEYEFPLDSNWEIPRSHLTLGSTLGEGAFGRVVMAEASGLPQAELSNSIVAVKMVKEEHTDADMASLVREMEVMKMIGKHINIINLLGCCTQNGPLWVIVEFAPHGNLKDFLKKNRPLSIGSPRSLQRKSEYLEEEKAPQLTEKHLISFAFQIARGMEYLASRRCIHRDLAARNVLVSDDYVIKIADFGLARDIQDTDYYRKNTNGRLPIKWMAPESLQEKFYDSQSDVWSYGVLLWEIMTYGEQPYPNIMSAEELYSYLITGQRMEKPARCSLNIYMLMRQCWHFDSSARPTFAEIVENLDKILQLAANSSPNEEYLDLSMPMLETPPSSSDEESETETLQESSPLRYQYTYKFK